MSQYDIENIDSGDMRLSEKIKKQILTWQILLMSLVSVVAALLFMDLLDGGLNLGQISLLSVILIPTLFALPIIVKKSKLLLIPCVILPLVVTIVCFIAGLLTYILFFLLLIALVAAPGISVGFLIKLIRAKMVGVKKRTETIAMVSGIIIPIISILLILTMFFVNPIGAFFANFKIQSYVVEHFPDYDLEVEFPRYDWKAGYFESNVASRENENINFRVIYWGDGRFWNYYNEVIAYYLTQILEEEFGDSVRMIQASNSRRTDHVFHDGNEVSIRLNVEIIDAYVLSEMIIKSWSLIEESGFEFASYNFHFYSDVIERMSINGLHPQYINDEELVLIIKGIYEDFVYHGRYRSVSHTLGRGTIGHR